MHTILQNEEQKKHKNKEMKRGASREINNLKCEMHEIKSMLKTLLERD